MIHPSRRQRVSERSDAEVFSLHKRMARREALHRRLVRGSVGALLAAVVALALALPLWQQVACLAAGFLAGAFVPVRGQLERAMGRIRRQAGLSYETALERGEVEDAFGMAAAVRQRARLATRDVREPNRPPWWLPALAAAVALLLLPLAGLTGPNPPGAVSPTPTAPPATTPDQATPPPPEAVPPPAVPPARSESSSPPSPSDAEDASASGDAGEAAGLDNQETLSRFLQDLRERPPESSSPPDEAGDPTQDQGNDGAQDANPNVQGRRAADPRAEPATQSEGETAGEAAGQEDGDARAGEGEGSEPTQAAERSEGGGEAGTQASEPTTEDGEQEQGSLGEQASGEASEGAEGDAEGGEQPGRAGMDEGLSAGNQPGEGSTAEGAALLAPRSQPEFLEGVLRPGPESSGGSIRLPGSTDVELPPGASAEGYRRAAEQALTEGNIPLEYQEIIRRYFR